MAVTVVFRIVILLLLKGIISSATPIKSEDPADKLAAKKLTDSEVTMYGRKTDLKALFGDSVVSDDFVPVINEPIADLDPSRVNLKVQSYGIDYIELNYNDRDKNRWTEIPGDDTPTAIARDLLARNKKFVMILGGPGSGRTVALTKILTVLRADPEITWSLLVNLKKAVPHPLPPDWEPSRIFSETLGPKQTQLFHELLKRNPQKINILLDNFNLIPDFNTRKNIYQYVETLYEKGAGIVLTTSLSTGQSIPIPNHDEIKTINADRAYVETPLLKTNEVLQLYITGQLELQFRSMENIPEYATAIAKVIGKMPVPKTFENVEQVSRLIMTGDRNIFVEDEFVDLKKHLMSENSNPKKFEKMLKSAEYNRMRLFEKLTARSVSSSNAIQHYGLEALNRIYYGYPLKSDFGWTLSPVMSNPDYKGNGEELGLLRHERYRSIFVYPEYDVYFAVKALLSKAGAGSREYQTIMLSVLVNQVKGPEVTEFMKFMDAAVAIDKSSGVQETLHAVTMNMAVMKPLSYAILNKLDSLAAGIIENSYRPYIFLILQIDSDISYKMIASDEKLKITRNGLYDRQEMLFKNGMIKSLRAMNKLPSVPINDVELETWRFGEFGRYADEMVVYPTKESMRTISMILECAPKEMRTETFFNERLFNVISNGGLKSRPIINKWIRHGAAPSRVNVNGKTLVHVAVKNRDLPLLKYLVENLIVKVIDATANVDSLLITALDSNPMPRYSLPHFWEVMEYLMSVTGGLDVPRTKSPRLTIGSVIPTAADEASPAYKLIIGTQDEASLAQARSELESLPGLVDELSSPVQQYRRNIVLARGMNQMAARLASDLTTQTEVLLKYRGLDELSQKEQAAYERCIRLAIEQDVTRVKGKLTDKQLDRIRSNLVDNIGTEADYKFARNFVEIDLKQAQIKAEDILKFSIAIDERFRQKISNTVSSLSSKVTLERGISQTRAEVYQPIDVSMDSDDFSSRPNLKSRIAGSILCGSIRRRRRDTSSCLITDQEYREIVTETVKDGKIIRKVSSEKFLELATQAEVMGQMEKYSELISIGRKLRESGAILEGRFTLRFSALTSNNPSEYDSKVLGKQLADALGYQASWRNLHRDNGKFPTNPEVHSLGTKRQISGTQALSAIYHSRDPGRQLPNRVGLHAWEKSGIQRPNIPRIPSNGSPKLPLFESIRYKPRVLKVPSYVPKFAFPKIAGRNGRK